MNLKPLLLMLGLACIPATLAAQKTYSLSSPDGNLRTTVTVGDEIRLRLDAGDTPLLAPSPVAMTLEGGEVLGQNARVVRTKKSSVDQTIASPLYKKNRVVERYNQLTLSFRGDFGLVVRLYDDGLAYRFTTDRKGTLRVEDECVAFTFPSDYRAVVPYVARGKEFDFESQFFNSFENTYTTAPITELNPGRLIFLPALVELDGGYKLVITEADLEGYPGLYLRGNGETPELRGVFAPYPKREEQGGHNRLQMLVREREGYIASTVGSRAFPWRTVIVAGRTASCSTTTWSTAWHPNPGSGTPRGSGPERWHGTGGTTGTSTAWISRPASTTTPTNTTSTSPRGTASNT